MRTIKELCAYYYVGLLVGYFNKKDVIEWADSVIESGNFPYELIDVSLSESRSIEYTASMLKRAYGENKIVEPLYKLLGDLVTELETRRITDELFFKYIQSINLQGIAFIAEEDLSEKLVYLDDGYYLASQGIYGDIESIRKDALQELNKYKEFVGIFDEA